MKTDWQIACRSVLALKLLARTSSPGSGLMSVNSDQNPSARSKYCLSLCRVSHKTNKDFFFLVVLLSYLFLIDYFIKYGLYL
jgi:hypothetical protein